MHSNWSDKSFHYRCLLNKKPFFPLHFGIADFSLISVSVILNATKILVTKFKILFCVQNIYFTKHEVFHFTNFSSKYEQIYWFLMIYRSSLTPATLLKKRLWHRCFPVNFVKVLRAPFLQNTTRWLLPGLLIFTERSLNTMTKA